MCARPCAGDGTDLGTAGCRLAEGGGEGGERKVNSLFLRQREGGRSGAGPAGGTGAGDREAAKKGKRGKGAPNMRREDSHALRKRKGGNQPQKTNAPHTKQNNENKKYI